MSADIILKIQMIIIFGITAFLIGWIFTPYYIKVLQKLKFKKQIRENAVVGKATQFHALHQHKSGTPTMGGGMTLLIIFGMVLLSHILVKVDF